MEWANAVKERDGKCMHCGREEDLHAHHINAKSTHPELKFDLSNGIALCYGCHKKEHERNRLTRIRSEHPQRKTLLKRIKELEKELALLKRQNPFKRNTTEWE